MKNYQELEAIDPREAFNVTPRPGSESDYSAAASQAALLLALRRGVLGSELPVDMPASNNKKDQFHLPNLKPLRREKRMKLAEATRQLGVSAQELEQEKAPEVQDHMNKLVHDVYQRPSIEYAAALFEAAMHSPHPLVAVAAAAGSRETTRLRELSRNTLEKGTRSQDPLVRNLAHAALGQIAPRDPLIKKRVIEQPKSRKRNRKSNTAVITHGTFAANKPWYQPGGDFYTALDAKRPDLDLHDRSFKWTGAYSHPARQADAHLLKQWITDQGLSVPDFFAHSHGATVAHLATRLGVEFDRLVLMSWPARDQWFPDFSKVKKIVDIRVRMDLVVLIDGGSNKFRTSQPIDRHKHGWFNHSATHEPDYWDKHDLWTKITA